MELHADPWPQYAAAHVELDAPAGRLLLRPLPEVVRDGPPAPRSAGDEVEAAVEAQVEGSWRALTTLLAVPEGTIVWIVTACDPYPMELDARTNEARTHALIGALDEGGFVHLGALARSPDHQAKEVSRAVIGATRSAVLDIAARFEQLAVFEIAQQIDCIATATAMVMTSRPYDVRRLSPAG
jgi:hypothetical protein